MFSKFIDEKLIKYYIIIKYSMFVLIIVVACFKNFVCTLFMLLNNEI